MDKSSHTGVVFAQGEQKCDDMEHVADPELIMESEDKKLCLAT